MLCAAQKRAKLAQIKNEIAKAEEEEGQLKEDISGLEDGREESDERSAALSELNTLEAELKKVTGELERFAEFDPDEMEKLKKNTKAAHEAANRWVDNIFTVQAWATRTFGMEKKDFNAQFGIPDELDYIE